MHKNKDMVTEDINDLRYVIFDYSEVDKIDFNQVLITSIDTLRLSIDGLKTFVKWIGSTPSCVDTLTTKGPILDNEQIRIILQGPDWTDQSPSGNTIN